MKRFNKLFTSLMIIIAASAAYGQSTTQGGVRIDGAHTAGNMVVFGDGGRSLVDVGVGFTEVTNAVNLAASAVQPYTDGNLDLTATKNIILSATDDVALTALVGDVIVRADGPVSDLELMATGGGSAALSAREGGGVIVLSDGGNAYLRAIDGNVNISGDDGVQIVAGHVEKALFSATTNYFAVPISVGNATTPDQALNQTVADGLYAPLSITNDLGVVAESVVNLSYVVNPSLWGLSINGDLEPMGVSAGLLDDGLFAIDLSTGDLIIAGTQSTRFWQVSGSDIYPEVN